MEHRSCPRENTRLLPFCSDCLTGRLEESQREPDFRSRKTFPCPGGDMLEKQYYILKKYLD